MSYRFAPGPSVAGMDCGCGACPECRPGVAEAARLADWTFADALDLANRAVDMTLCRLVDLNSPPANRAEQRRRERARVKADRAVDRGRRRKGA